MTSKELLQQALAHSQPERIVFDMGSTAVTGIHVRALEKLRMYYGLEKRPVHVIEPYQMLGLVEPDLMDAIGVDVTGAWGEENLLGYNNNPPLKLFKTFWGQEVLVPEKFSTVTNEKGELLSFPDGDKSVDASAKMPESGYFFDAIDRQQPIDEDKLNVEDNLEEFSLISSKTLSYWRQEVARAKSTGKAIVAGFGGTALGDIALVPAMNLKNPKGIRNIEEWYISTMLRSEYVREIFDRQSALAVENLRRIFTTVGNDIDVVFICGTDFGTQNSSFCAPEQFDDLWLPYYKRINDWIHTNTSWKTFKHSCGAVEGFMSRFIEAGFDIINPVQLSATGMHPEELKEKYGKHLTFWGGGIDTQKTLPYGTPADVRKEVLHLCEVFGRDGGFVFNTVHNIQADVPVENIVAMIDAVHDFNFK
jgi:hypothetical protein